MMPHRGDIDAWLVQLAAADGWLPSTPAEAERAARLAQAPARSRFLRSHAALRAILARYTVAPLEFALAEFGKPYLPAVPDLKFNLSHSHEIALVAVAHGIEVGVDVEWQRPLAECLSIAERFFPAGEFAAFAEVPAAGREAEFFRRWTRIEAVLKARGIGLYGAGTEAEGECTVEAIDSGPGYAAAVAAACGSISVRMRSFAG